MSVRRQNKARVRSAILDAAQRLFEVQGLADTTVRDMAKLAQVSYQTVYNHFPTKATVVQAMLAADTQAWRANVEAIVKQYNGHLLTSLKNINGVGFTLLNGRNAELWREVSRHQEELETLNRVPHERYHALFSIAQGTGELAPGVDLHLLAHTVQGMSDYALMRYLGAENQDSEAFLQTLQDQLALVISPYLLSTRTI